MKIFKLRSFVLFFSVSFLLIHCTAVEETEDVGNKFFTSLQKKDYDEIKKHLHPNLLKEYPLEEWDKKFQQIDAVLGELKSFEKQPGGVNYDNGVSTATVTYDVIYENGKRTEKITCVTNDDDDDYKIIAWNWELVGDLKSPSSTQVSDMADEVGNQFYDILSEYDVDGVMSLLHPSLLEQVPEERWVNMFAQMETELGFPLNIEATGESNSETTNNAETQKRIYRVQYENGVRTESLTFHPSEGIYKIIEWNWQNAEQ